MRRRAPRRRGGRVRVRAARGLNRWPLALGMLAVLAVVALASCGRGRFTTTDTRLALAAASPRARCIVAREVGGGTAGYAPYAPDTVGDGGTSFGVLQLHDSHGMDAGAGDGLLADFYRRGYADPFDPYQAVAYLDDALDRGLSRHWSPVKRGLCP